MQIIFERSFATSPGVWLTTVPAHQLGLFGPPAATRGNTSILLVAKPAFDEEKEQLIVQAEGLAVLNLGTTSRTLVVDAEVEDVASVLEAEGHSQGPGDREYRSLVDVLLKGEAREVAHDILTKVREAHPGDLKRGERNNFSNTPDNFWYVIVQPRTQALSITVRGEPDRFSPSSLELAPDRPGYTRFQVRYAADLEETLRLIQASKRSRFTSFRRI